MENFIPHSPAGDQYWHFQPGSFRSYSHDGMSNDRVLPARKGHGFLKCS
jgi:hypothetical protein